MTSRSPLPSCPIPPFRSRKVPTTPVAWAVEMGRTSAGGNGRSESDGIARAVIAVTVTVHEIIPRYRRIRCMSPQLRRKRPALALLALPRFNWCILTDRRNTPPALGARGLPSIQNAGYRDHRGVPRPDRERARAPTGTAVAERQLAYRDRCGNVAVAAAVATARRVDV